ncbi:phage holin family protein [Xanthobacter sp. DSM 24535]|uniref:phage holin family protein n=1 Tax=Roseixanthobacter psychrophilus TaxID=3119917 RepID=UPI00372AE74F
MKLDNALRNLKVLWRADSIIADIHLRALLARSGVFTFAALIAASGVLMLGFATYLALAELWGPVWAAVAVGGGNIVVAGIAALIATAIKPGRDLDFAHEIHKSAIEALAGDLKDAEGEVKMIANAIRHPFDSALPALLVPVVGSLLKGLRSDRGK